LQTVISLLRKQSRLTDNEEVKMCLDNVTNRVFAILSNHHLLSKQMDNSISILQAINLLISNIQGGYCDDKNINIYITGEDFKI
ncbi:histidine kinase, partial [Casaltella massiliensis]|nr:histidine kinase [Casaltella massiliensis]